MQSSSTVGFQLPENPTTSQSSNDPQLMHATTVASQLEMYRSIFQNATQNTSTSSINNYKISEKIAEGSHGVVFRGMSMISGTMVALKLIKKLAKEDGVSTNLIHEAGILQQVQHRNIVTFIEVFMENSTLESPANCWLITEYCACDLLDLVMVPNLPISVLHIKSLLQSLLKGVAHLHKRSIMHRDIKKGNLLIDNHGVLRIADFGLAIQVTKLTRTLKTNIGTMVFRAPELLLDDIHYTKKVDIWNVGWVLFSLFTGKPGFNVQTTNQVLTKLTHMCGSITEDTYAGCQNLEAYKGYRKRNSLNWPRMVMVMARRAAFGPDTEEISDKNEPSHLQRDLKESGIMGIELIDQMLTLDPTKRPTAAEVLDNEWFKMEPLPNPSISDLLGEYKKYHREKKFRAYGEDHKSN
ncbi:hypothetical protein CRE_05995 [Caenorhabditis remanei]|uniref:Protein kinase domain-containing protein n=1 Tax=Caenorhabditis remanei TaxID=31234 RepID=E3MZG7_CAERE|nr:hypothetical protein CRE_05995 [Caenorhabditis remanei]